MAEERYGYDPDAIDADDGAESGASKEYQQWREVTVYLIDAQPAMHQAAGMEGDGLDPTDTWFAIALKVLRSVLKSKIISSPNDQSAVIFYGTRESKTSNDHGGNGTSAVYLFQQMRVPSARRIRECEDLLQGKTFAADIGSAAGKGATRLREGLSLASQQLQGTTKHATRTVVVFTNNADPAADSSASDAAKVETVVAEMGEMGVKFDLTPMVPPAEQLGFLHAGFWRHALPALAQAAELATKGAEAEPLMPSIMQGLGTAIRYKAFKKRPLRSTRLTFGPDFAVGVQLFANIKTAAMAGHVWVDAAKHQPLRAETADICGDTGGTLTAATLRKRVFPKQSDAGKMHFPQVFLTVDELEDMRQMVPDGVHVLGFKPLAALEQHHQLREPTFMYPDERHFPGSTAAFIALHGEMLGSRVMAVASESRGKFAPKLMALLAIQEVQDEFGAQLEPPGLQMVQLPFSDDVRTPEADPAWVGVGHPVPDESAVDAAAGLIQALQLPDFYSGCVVNPALQRHYQVLEKLALGEEDSLETEGDGDGGSQPLPDPTLPDAELFESAAPAIQAFKDATYGANFTADIDSKAANKTAAKRKAAELGDVERELAERTDWADLAAKDQLQTLTVPQLKVYCKANGLPVSGAKAAILGRIEAHLAKKK